MGESPKNSAPQRPELQTGVGLSAWEDPMGLRKAGRKGLQAARRSGPASPGHQAGVAAILVYHGTLDRSASFSDSPFPPLESRHIATYFIRFAGKLSFPEITGAIFRASANAGHFANTLWPSKKTFEEGITILCSR